MTVIEKKTWPEEFGEILSGKKKYELRLADFDVSEGDTIRLKEWNPETKEFTGRSVEKKVTFVGKFRANELPYYSPEEIEKHGLQIISLE